MEMDLFAINKPSTISLNTDDNSFLVPIFIVKTTFYKNIVFELK